MKSVFFLSSFLIVYTYLLYPVILAILSRLPFLKKQSGHGQPGEPPKISLIVSVYNEERVIEEKIKNCLELDYPREKLEILIGSDGSTDRTNETLNRYKGHNLFFYEFGGREGKPSVVNRLVQQATGDILILSDGDIFLEKDCLKKMVARFADKKVGGVCGKIRFKKREGMASEGIYWKYESWIKRMEGSVGSTLQVSGGFYAMRKELWCEMPEGTLIDDFVVSMKIVEKGYALAYEPEAVAWGETAASTDQEFIRRVRYGAGGFQALAMLYRLLNPMRGLIAWEFWSHKVIRWFGPFLMIAAFFSNAMLLGEGKLYLVLFVIQVFFYLTALAGRFRDGGGLLGAPYHFVMINAALFLGFFHHILGLQKVTWKQAKK